MKSKSTQPISTSIHFTPGYSWESSTPEFKHAMTKLIVKAIGAKNLFKTNTNGKPNT